MGEAGARWAERGGGCLLSICCGVSAGGASGRLLRPGPASSPSCNVLCVAMTSPLLHCRWLAGAAGHAATARGPAMPAGIEATAPSGRAAASWASCSSGDPMTARRSQAKSKRGEIRPVRCCDRLPLSHARPSWGRLLQGCSRLRV